MRSFILVTAFLMAGCSSIHNVDLGAASTDNTNHVQASCGTYSDFECRMTLHSITYMLSCPGNSHAVFVREDVAGHVYRADFICR